MAFTKKTWVARQGTGLNKFSINGATPVTVVNQPDSVTEQGDALSATNLNNLEQRIYDAFDDVADDIHDVIENIEDGTLVAKKAEQDANGNEITTTYETKADASELKSEIDNNSQRIENLEVAVSGSLVQINTDATQKNAKTITNANIILPWALLNRVGARAVAWNQQCNFASFPNSTTVGGVTYTKGTDKLTFSASGETRELVQLILDHYSLIAGHRYLLLDGLMGKNYNWSDNSISLRMSYGTSYAWSANGYAFFTPTTSEIGTFQMIIGTSADLTNPLVVVPQLFDLTAMNEYDSTKTDAQNIANFKAKFSASYYPNNNGQIIPLNPSGFKVVGWNKWDEEWKLGALSVSTGNEFASDTLIVCKNYQPIFSSTSYYFNAPVFLRVCWYDANKNFIGYTEPKNSTETSPANAFYMRFCTIQASYGTTYKHDICINISQTDSTKPLHNGVYKSYSETTIDTSFMQGKKYINSDVYDYAENVYVDGVLKRKEQTVVNKYTFTGTEVWENRGQNAAGKDVYSLDVGSIIPYWYNGNAKFLYNHGIDLGATSGINVVLSRTDTYGLLFLMSIGQRYLYAVGLSLSELSSLVCYYQPETLPDPTYADPIPNFPCEVGTTVQAVTPQTDLVNTIDVPSTIAYMTKIGG